MLKSFDSQIVRQRTSLAMNQIRIIMIAHWRLHSLTITCIRSDTFSRVPLSVPSIHTFPASVTLWHSVHALENSLTHNIFIYSLLLSVKNYRIHLLTVTLLRSLNILITHSCLYLLTRGFIRTLKSSFTRSFLQLFYCHLNSFTLLSPHFIDSTVNLITKSSIILIHLLNCYINSFTLLLL